MVDPIYTSWWLPQDNRLTEQQLASIGSVLTEWSVMDIQIQSILSMLAVSPLALGHFLVDDLSPDNRLKAIKELVKTHRENLGAIDLAKVEEWFGKLDSLTLWIKKNKGLRNQIAHWAWIKHTDEIIHGFKFSPRNVSEFNHVELSLDDLKKFAENIRENATLAILISLHVGELRTSIYRWHLENRPSLSRQEQGEG
jgi:hypothetical protein